MEKYAVVTLKDAETEMEYDIIVITCPTCYNTEEVQEKIKKIFKLYSSYWSNHHKTLSLRCKYKKKVKKFFDEEFDGLDGERTEKRFDFLKTFSRDMSLDTLVELVNIVYRYGISLIPTGYIRLEW